MKSTFFKFSFFINGFNIFQRRKAQLLWGTLNIQY